jgi:hypothetical protein
MGGFVNREIDRILDEVIDGYYEKVDRVGAIIMEAKGTFVQYDNIRFIVDQICSGSCSDENKILELRENFYTLIKRINSLNQELYEIIFATDILKGQNQSTEQEG